MGVELKVKKDLVSVSELKSGDIAVIVYSNQATGVRSNSFQAGQLVQLIWVQTETDNVNGYNHYLIRLGKDWNAFNTNKINDTDMKFRILEEGEDITITKY